MKQVGYFVVCVLSAVFFGVAVVKAAVSFGNGYYVNLCGGGTSATVYKCDSGCNPTDGSCVSQNQGAVSYVCNGRWDQCLEGESWWSNKVQIGTQACGQTVQLSLYDHKCRREDGSWDSTCQLLGYMVWYSGDCWNSNIVPSSKPYIQPTPMLSPTVSPSPTVKLSPTGKPTPTSASKIVFPISTPGITPILGGKVCNRTCSDTLVCPAGFACVNQSCRNPACSSDLTCFCGSATGSAVKKTPETGGEMWIVLAGAAGVIGLGMVFRKVARQIW